MAQGGAMKEGVGGGAGSGQGLWSRAPRPACTLHRGTAAPNPLWPESSESTPGQLGDPSLRAAWGLLQTILRVLFATSKSQLASVGRSTAFDEQGQGRGRGVEKGQESPRHRGRHEIIPTARGSSVVTAQRPARP